MFVTKLKRITAVALVLAVVLAGGGWLIDAALEAEQGNPAINDPPPDRCPRPGHP